MFFVAQDGTTAIMTAAARGHIDFVVDFVQKGANVDLQKNV